MLSCIQRTCILETSASIYTSLDMEEDNMKIDPLPRHRERERERERERGNNGDDDSSSSTSKLEAVLGSWT